MPNECDIVIYYQDKPIHVKYSTVKDNNNVPDLNTLNDLVNRVPCFLVHDVVGIAYVSRIMSYAITGLEISDHRVILCIVVRPFDKGAQE